MRPRASPLAPLRTARQVGEPRPFARRSTSRSSPTRPARTTPSGLVRALGQPGNGPAGRRLADPPATRAPPRSLLPRGLRERGVQPAGPKTRFPALARPSLRRAPGHDRRDDLRQRRRQASHENNRSQRGFRSIQSQARGSTRHRSAASNESCHGLRQARRPGRSGCKCNRAPTPG